MDYPEVPPGCRYFNPRRLRRHARKLQEYEAAREKRRAAEAKIREQRQQRIADRKAALAEERAKQVGSSSLVNKVKGFTKRLFGRKTA